MAPLAPRQPRSAEPFTNQPELRLNRPRKGSTVRRRAECPKLPKTMLSNLPLIHMSLS